MTARRQIELHAGSIYGIAPTGFSLMEVMVALLVLSIGLLGLAALQTFGMQYSQHSYQRTQAVFQAYDIIDRIRANAVGKATGCYNVVAEGATAAVGACAVAFVNCEALSCNPNQLANYDINKWNTANAQLLAAGKGSISTSVAAPARRTITIRWLENDLPASLVMDVDL